MYNKRERPLTWNKERHRIMTLPSNTDTIGKRFEENYFGIIPMFQFAQKIFGQINQHRSGLEMRLRMFW